MSGRATIRQKISISGNSPDNFSLELVHIHANNYDLDNKMEIPNTLEITFAKNPKANELSLLAIDELPMAIACWPEELELSPMASALWFVALAVSPIAIDRSIVAVALRPIAKAPAPDTAPTVLT